MRNVKSAGDDERGAWQGPDVGHFAENQIAEDADPLQALAKFVGAGVRFAPALVRHLRRSRPTVFLG